MYNKVVGSLRLALGSLLLVSVAWQVTDRVANNLFRPGEYFAYFSIVTAIVAGLVSLWAALVVLQNKAESKFLNIARLSLTAALVVVGVVYHALLADAAPDSRDIDYVWPVLPNQIIHTYAPVAIAIDYLISLKSPRLRLRAALWVTIFPLTWLGFSVIRGLATNWWPYWFINPNLDAGVAGVLFYVGGITVFFLALGFGFQAMRLGLGRLIRSS